MERVEELVDTGREYVPGDPVRLRVVRRGSRIRVSDATAAIARAGHPSGWREVARRIEEDFVVNVGRNGEVFLPVVHPRPGWLDTVVRRIGEASLALYQELLELTA